MANADDLGRRLGHTVAAFPGFEALCASGVSALVIASPVEHHLEALEAAASRRLPVLCEKPLVHEHHGAEGSSLLEEFARSQVPLMENCQWPYVLTAFGRLHPVTSTARASKVEMGLQPAPPARAMVQNTLSHLLSVVQQVSAIGPETTPHDVSLESGSPDGWRLRFGLRDAGGDVEAALHLTIAASRPRAAWLALDDRRMDRRVGAEYQIAFVAGERKVDIADPMQQLVNRFVALVDARDSAQIAGELALVRARHRLYRQILHALH